MPRTVALAAYALACVLALAGGVVAGAIHAATDRGDPTIGVPLPSAGNGADPGIVTFADTVASPPTRPFP